jgi:DNA-binding LacI/PurR family transcriptional regulator
MSVNLSIYRMGRLALELLLEAMQDPENHVPKKTFTEARLVVRDSSG